jgi:hypothetical protein
MGTPPNAALLPINRRADYRRPNGIPGTLTFEEALRLCEQLQRMNTAVQVLFAGTRACWRIDKGS